MNIKVLLINIYSDGDFYWDSQTYPKNENETIEVFFENPSNKDISDVISSIAHEFYNSFWSSREYFVEIKEEIYFWLIRNTENKEFFSCYNDRISMELLDIKEKEIVCTNGRKVKLLERDLSLGGYCF